jgi:uncharacterized protein (DUF2249 family)
MNLKVKKELYKTCKHPDCNIKEPQPIDNFFINGYNRINVPYYRSICKICFNAKQNKHRNDNIDEYNVYQKKRYWENRDYFLDHNAKYRKTEGFKTWRENHYNENKEYIIKRTVEWERNRAKTPEYKLQRFLRGLVYKALKSKKDGHSHEILGYTHDELKNYIESQFENKYSWDSYGNGPDQWSIDHIIPVASFTFILEDGSVDYDAVRECHTLSNLRPLWNKDNAKKLDRMPDGSLGRNKKEVKDIV